jgi:hypothetical protein
MTFVAEVAAGRGEVLTRNAASETGTSTAEMAPAKAAAHASATAEAADVTAAESAADMSATPETASMSTAEATPVSTPTSAAARKRISGKSSDESGSRCQDDHACP